MSSEFVLLTAACALVGATFLAAVLRRRLPLIVCGLLCVGFAAVAWRVNGKPDGEADDHAAEASGHAGLGKLDWMVASATGVLVAVAGLVLQSQARAAEKRIKNKLASLGEQASELSEDLDQLRGETAEIRARGDEGWKLYQATRALGEVVDIRPAMVEEFGNCLKSVFSLESAYLVFLDNEDPERAFRTYDLLSATRDEDHSPLDLLRSHGLSPHYFGVKQSQGSVAAGLPLRFGGKVQAAITIEGVRFPEKEAHPDEVTSILDLFADQFNMTYNRCMLHYEVMQMSVTDGLTSVRKKRYLLERAREELDRVKEEQLPTSFVMFDIDHFKNYNDTYGHLVGDVVLRHVAGFLRGNIRAQDLVGRYGGEEFLVVLVETPKDGGKVVAERIRRAVEEFRFPVEDKDTGITISAGLATAPGDAAELDQVVEKADEALYRAKQSGRNRICVAGE